MRDSSASGRRSGDVPSTGGAVDAGEMDAGEMDAGEEARAQELPARVIEEALEGVMVLRAVREGTRIADFEWVLLNARAAETLGASEHDLVGRRLLGAFPVLKTSDFFEACVQVAQGGASTRGDLFHEAGPFRGWFQVRIVRLRRAGAPAALAVTFHDVTERREATDALRESEEHFRVVAENISDLVCLHEADGTCTFTSPSSWRILGFAPDEVQGRRPQQLAHPEDRAGVRAALKRARGGERVTVQVRLRHRDGSYRHVETACRPIYGSGGTVVRLLTSTRDVTERVQAQQESRRINAELRLRNRELQDFAHIASHDLQEPLRKVRAFAGLMREDYDEQVDETGRYYLERMQDGAERMARLVSDLLSLSRVTTKGHPFEDVDLNDLAHTARTDLEMRLEDTGGRVEIGPLPRLEADPTQMRQLLQNLIGNALKFHREGVPPVVQVHGAREPVSEHAEADFAPGTDEVCRLTVEDNGVGFEEKFVDRIFTPLQRLHSRSEYEGTGIGLAVCRRIAERHGGTIGAESTPGAGSRFIVRLPTQQPRDDPPDDHAPRSGTTA